MFRHRGREKVLTRMSNAAQVLLCLVQQTRSCSWHVAHRPAPIHRAQVQAMCAAQTRGIQLRAHFVCTLNNTGKCRVNEAYSLVWLGQYAAAKRIIKQQIGERNYRVPSILALCHCIPSAACVLVRLLLHFNEQHFMRTEDPHGGACSCADNCGQQLR